MTKPLERKKVRQHSYDDENVLRSVLKTVRNQGSRHSSASAFRNSSGEEVKEGSQTVSRTVV